MACSFSPSSATRLRSVDAARNARVHLRAASVQRSLGGGGGCRAARQEGATTQDPTVSASSARTQLDLLEQLTSDGIGTNGDMSGADNGAAAEPCRRQQVAAGTTIREQLAALIGDREEEFTLPLGKKLKEGLKRLNSLTVSQRRNIKRQALLTKVGGRNDSVFFATVGAFVLVPPLAILAVAVLTGYVQLLP